MLSNDVNMSTVERTAAKATGLGWWSRIHLTCQVVALDSVFAKLKQNVFGSH